MNIDNLVFFDKNGESYNFSQNSDGVWEGSDYFLPISTALYDVSNIFILEKTQNGYRFPALAPSSTLNFKWKKSEHSNNLFLFTLIKEDQHTTSSTFINKQSSILVNYSDIDPTGLVNLDLSYPLQINVGFSPTDEVKYDRTLEIYYEVNNTSTKIASIYFYGEGEDEDERFRVWLTNFGIKFNREDALLLKTYDLKESLPDWKQINQARKEILVNRDQIYPYVGTYKGLTNLINILGYKDIIKVKEYWQDQDSASSYYGKYAMIDITELMSIGEVNDINLVDLNGQIKKGGKFKKTEFLALVYEFSVITDSYDDDGLPEVVATTEFESNEIFYKLNRLSEKLKNEILPVNVIIRDIIGEFIYFSKFNLRYWSDNTHVNSLQINDAYTVKLNQPNTKSQLLLIRDIKTLYHKTNGSAFPIITFNETSVNPYEYSQIYPVDSIPGLLTAITDYYSNLKSYEFQYHGQSNIMISGDDISGKVGCPVNLEAYIPEFMLGELDGSKFGDFTNTQFTIGNIRYRDGYEVEWNITGPQGYSFNRRGKLSDLVKLPHFLPRVGEYVIQSIVYGLLGEQNVAYVHITVLEEEPVIEAFTKLQDKSSYRFKDLTNITINDIKDSPIYLPFVNVVQSGQTNSTLATHYLDWFTYSNNFGVGNPQTEVDIYTEGIGFEPITTSSNQNRIYWGTGSSFSGQPTLGDYRDAKIEDLKLNRLSDLSYSPDKLNGFILRYDLWPNPIVSINFADWNPLNSYQILAYSDIDDLADQLNSSTNKQVMEYRYVVVNGTIHAHAKLQNRQLHRILLITDSLGFEERVYTFCYPSETYTQSLISELNSQLQQIGREIDEDLLFLNAPFADCIRRTHETCISNTPQTITNSGSLIFELNRYQDFDYIAKVKVYSAANPTVNYMYGYCTQSALNYVTITISDSNGSGNYADWRFEYIKEAPHVQSTYAAASDITYWINKKFIEFINPTSIDVEVNGYLPSAHDESSFNLVNLKIGLDGLIVPLHQPVIAAITNIDSKKECIWTLTLDNSQIVKIRSNSYFIWRFSIPGDYLLSVEVTDVNNNKYTLTRSFNVVDSLAITNYLNYVENILNLRKALM